MPQDILQLTDPNTSAQHIYASEARLDIFEAWEKSRKKGKLIPLLQRIENEKKI